MQSLTHLAFQVDKRLGTATFTPLYRAYTFRPDTVIEQESSQLLRLPTEIRLMIYAYVFTPSQDTNPAAGSPNNPLSLLATCRLIHGESLPLALSQSHFYLSYPSRMAFARTLHSLGALQRHLRYVRVRIPVQYLRTYASINPFHLTELPLEQLVVDLGSVQADSWMDENAAYHFLVSAMLYRPSLPSKSSTSVSSRAGIFERTKRKIAIMTFSQWARPSQLREMVEDLKCRKLIIVAERDEKDVVWSALVYFGLVRECVTLFEGEKGKKDRRKKGDGGRRYVICGDEGEKSFLECGVWPPRGYVWEE